MFHVETQKKKPRECRPRASLELVIQRLGARLQGADQRHKCSLHSTPVKRWPVYPLCRGLHSGRFSHKKLCCATGGAGEPLSR